MRTLCEQVYKIDQKGEGLDMLSYEPFTPKTGQVTVAFIPFKVIKAALKVSEGDQKKFFDYVYRHMTKDTVIVGDQWLSNYRQDIMDDKAYPFSNLTMAQMVNMANADRSA